MADDILLYLMNESEISYAENNQQIVSPMFDAQARCSSVLLFTLKMD